MKQDIPEVLDWVKERAACTPFLIFETLRGQVEKDMHARNAFPPDSGFVKRNFTFQGQGTWFAVVLPRQFEGGKGVSFYLTPIGVTVKNIETHTVLYEAVLTLSDDGKCRLKVDNTEYNLWQFRKLALHDLFFVDQEVVL
jgi:hypothetical protein